MNRRNFLKSTAGFGLATMAGFGGAFEASAAPYNIDNMGKIKKVGVQLYTVRDHMAKSVEKTVAPVAGFGYKEVEFAGYFDHSAKNIRKILDDNGLTSPSVHVQLSDIQKDNMHQTIENANIIGHKYVTMAGFGNSERETLDQFKGHAEHFNMVGEACKAAGVQLGYHNHEFEFDALDGVEPYDLFLELDKDILTMEMDLFWAIKAGRNPLTYFDKHPGRFHMCHVKDMAAGEAMVDVGAGNIDFAKIFAASEKAGLKHYFVEHDRPKSSLDSIRFSCETLLNMKVDI